MNHQIIVGIDDSAGARRALAWAVAQAAATSSALTAVHSYVGSVSWIDVGSADEDKMRKADKKRAVEAAQKIVADVPAGDVDITVVAAVGEPTKVLLDRAADADLLVVGSRGRGGFAGALLGSVSHRCALHSPCTVVIVPDHRK